MGVNRTRRSAISERPVIASGWGMPSSSRMVGATSARMPGPSSASPSAVTISGTGLSEWAVLGEPSGSSMWSQLPWSAVTMQAPPASPDRLDHVAEAAVDLLDRGDRGGDHPGVPDHVGVGEVDDPEAVVAGRPVPANWPTNPSNAMRVTMNQTLIVALGAMVDGADGTLPKVAAGGAPIPGLDSAHATPGTACYGCHQLLDPTRSILAATYSWSYHAQDLSAQKAQTGEFAFQGVIQFPKSVYNLGGILASHPLFATAWVQKLCHYANSRPCETSDPEFLRIVRDFQDDAFSWNDLVVDLLASPLTTNAKSTATGTHDGVIVSVSRREHLCATLGARLGVRDLCALLPTTTPISPSIPKIASGFPSDGYGRGVVAPVLPNQPSLFFRAGTENLCEAIAPLVIDNDSPPPGVRRWSSASSAAVAQAILDFVPDRSGAGAERSALRRGGQPSGRFEEALGAVDSVTGEKDFTAHDALQSTFVVACETPSAVSLGM